MFTQAKSLLKSRIAIALLAVAMFFIFSAFPSVQNVSAKASAVQQCLWYKRVHHYTDVTYTIHCGVSTYLCDGGVAHSGCWTAFSIVTATCECIEE